MLLAEGHQAVALVRPDSSSARGPWPHDSGARVELVDMQDSVALASAIAGCDVVVHASSALTGDEATQHAVTVAGTQALLDAMAVAGIKRLVGLGSLSVYGWSNLAAGDCLTEATPLESCPDERDVYARCKLQQDILFTAFGQRADNATVILRPGIFYGPKPGEHGNASGLWNFALGRPLGRGGWLLMGPMGPISQVPLVHVEDVALGVLAALVLLDAPHPAGTQAFNLVEDPVPNRSQLVELLNHAAPRTMIAVPWRLHLWLARAATLVGTLVPGVRERLPGVLQPAALWARHAPVRFDNSLALNTLGWMPRHSVLQELTHP